MADADADNTRELTIGELASMTRLTTRALRHYDQIGLLPPARVDPSNGYRLYEAGQIVTASTIAVLRGLDIDVDTITRLLDGSVRLGDVLIAERARREREASQAAASLAVLESLAQQRETTGPDSVEIVDVPAALLIGASIRVAAADDVEAAGAAFDELFAAAGAAGIESDPDAICIIRRSSREQLHLDICVRPIGAVEPPPGYHEIAVDGGPVATMMHRGPLESLPLAHAHIHSWILATGARVIGSAREIYVGDLADQTTRIEVPVELRQLQRSV